MLACEGLGCEVCEGADGSVINTRAFSCDKFSVISFSFLARCLRNFAKNMAETFLSL